jgi:hypothetical protein
MWLEAKTGIADGAAMRPASTRAMLRWSGVKDLFIDLPFYFC